MNARWSEVGVGAVRDEDGVWRQRGDTKEFAEPGTVHDEGEEKAIETFFPLNHNAEVSATLALLQNTPGRSSAASDEELLSPWELELEIREATIEGLERKIGKSERDLRILQTGKLVLRGKPQRLAQLREHLAQLKHELEEERAIAQSYIPTPGAVEIVYHRRIPTDTVRARRPRDPNKIQ